MAWDNRQLEQHLSDTARGDREAFRSLYDLTSSHLLLSVHRIIRDRMISEDVLQDVFISVWNHAADYQAAKGRGIDWLRRIAHNAAIDEVRRQSRGPRAAAPAEIDAQIASDGDPVAMVLNHASNKELMNCLGTVGEDHRESLLKAYVLGFTRKEIAEEKGVAVGTVKSWISRGLSRLKECME